MLAEPGVPHRRGAGMTPGRLIERFGDRRARQITTREVADYLRALERAGASPLKVNSHRQVISGLYGYVMREDSHAFDHNPARGRLGVASHRRRCSTSTSLRKSRRSLVRPSAASTETSRS
jgi:hypothetical protein